MRVMCGDAMDQKVERWCNSEIASWRAGGEQRGEIEMCMKCHVQ